MEEFDNDYANRDNDTVSDENDEIVSDNQSADSDTAKSADVIFENVNNPVMPLPENPASSANKKGIKVFSLILALIILLAGIAAASYFAGKNYTDNKNNSVLNMQTKPSGNEKSANEIYNIVNKSVVGIAVYDSKNITEYASGVIFSEDGYIITNDHIYANTAAAKFKIYTYNGMVFDAKFVAGDSRTDIAVLKVDSTGFFPATFGNSEELNIGDYCAAVSKSTEPAADSSISLGNISVLNQRIQNDSSYSQKLIQTDAAINPASSGGALVNMYGQVIGIIYSKLDPSTYDGVGFAIPSLTVKSTVEALIADKKVTGRARLGISYNEIDAVTAAIAGTKTGLYIAEVSKDSNLYGKLNEGDIITSVNGIEIVKDDVILDIIEGKKPGDTISLTVLTSNNKTVKLEAKLLEYVGTSSYNQKKESDNGNDLPNASSDSDGTFDFPYGY